MEASSPLLQALCYQLFISFYTKDFTHKRHGAWLSRNERGNTKKILWQDKMYISTLYFKQLLKDQEY